MPIPVNSVNMVRVYAVENPSWTSGSYSGTNLGELEHDPALVKPTWTQISNSFLGYYTWNGLQYKATGARIEMTEVKDDNNVILHRRTLYTFDTQGGSSVSSQTKTFGVETVSTPATPTKAGYTFAGWWTLASGGSQITSWGFLAGSADVTYYAHWVLATPDAPTLVSFTTSGSIYTITLRNDNAFAVTIYAELNDTTPDVSRGSIASGATVTFTQAYLSTPTLYAKSTYNGVDSSIASWVYGA